MTESAPSVVSHPFVASLIAELSGADRAGEDCFAKKIEVLKPGEHSYAGIYRDAITGDALFVKCYFPKGVVGRLLSRLGMSRADRAYRLTTTMDSELPVARPLGFVSNRYSGRAYLFSPLIAGENLSELFKTGRLEGAALYAVLGLAGHQLARYHLAGWSHGDFKWGNILVLPQREGYPPQLCFIDLDSAVRGASPSVLARDLARFIVNAEDYAVGESIMQGFIDQYADTRGMPVDAILRQCRRPLAKLRRRHDKKYGLRKAPLFDQRMR